MKKIIILFAAILLFAASAFAQIEGRVVDAKGNGVPNVTVTATGEDGKVASTTTTDEDGNYAFEDLDAGKYKITAKGPAGFQSSSHENVNVAEDETTTLNITLTAAIPPPAVTPQKPADPPPAAQQVNPPANPTSCPGPSSGSAALLSGPGEINGNSVQFWPIRWEAGGTPFSRNKGRVRWFNKAKGFGFICRDEGPDVFFHVSAIQDADKSLEAGDEVEFEIVQGQKGPQAVNITKVRRLPQRSGSDTRTINGELTDIETTYSNYKKNADGYLFPYTTGGVQGETNYDKIETNIAVDPAILSNEGRGI